MFEKDYYFDLVRSRVKTSAEEKEDKKDEKEDKPKKDTKKKDVSIEHKFYTHYHDNPFENETTDYKRFADGVKWAVEHEETTVVSEDPNFAKIKELVVREKEESKANSVIKREIKKVFPREYYVGMNYIHVGKSKAGLEPEKHTEQQLEALFADKSEKEDEEGPKKLMPFWYGVYRHGKFLVAQYTQLHGSSKERKTFDKQKTDDLLKIWNEHHKPVS